MLDVCIQVFVVSGGLELHSSALLNWNALRRLETRAIAWMPSLLKKFLANTKLRQTNASQANEAGNIILNYPSTLSLGSSLTGERITNLLFNRCF